jgi:pimeloyl-ACP methyl ester carboxylesterase
MSAVMNEGPAVDVTERRSAAGVASWAVVVAGVCLALLAAADGSPGWRLVRLGAVAVATWLLLALLAVLTPRWRGRASVLAALPTLAVAVGFAPFVVERGAFVVSAATIGLGVASLVVLTVGFADATRGLHAVRRWVSGVVVAVTTAVVLLVVAPAIAATNVPRPAIGSTPASIGVDYDDVRLRTVDGVDLAAWYVPSLNRAAVVLLHGAGSTRSDVLDQAAVLAAAGYGVLLVDARGHGESGGRAMDFGWEGDRDVAAATAFLAGQPDVDAQRIGIVGMSMGGEEALGAMASDHLIRAVIAEGATARVAADEAWLSDVHGWRGALQERLEQVQDAVTDVLTATSPPQSMRGSVAAGSAPVLLITAADVDEEGHAADFISAGAPDRVDVWRVPAAGHTEGLERSPAQWRERVIGFLDESLGPVGIAEGATSPWDRAQRPRTMSP